VSRYCGNTRESEGTGLSDGTTGLAASSNLAHKVRASEGPHCGGVFCGNTGGRGE